MEDEQDCHFPSRNKLYRRIYICDDEFLFDVTSCGMCVLYFLSTPAFDTHFFLFCFCLVFTLLPLGGCYPDVLGPTLWISYTVLLIYDSGSFLFGFSFLLLMLELLSLLVMVALMAYPAIKQCKCMNGNHGLVTLFRDVFFKDRFSHGRTGLMRRVYNEGKASSLTLGVMMC